MAESESNPAKRSRLSPSNSKTSSTSSFETSGAGAEMKTDCWWLLLLVGYQKFNIMVVIFSLKPSKARVQAEPKSNLL